MITRMGLLQKKQGLSTEAFKKHWKEIHGPIALKAKKMRRYHQNLVIDSEQRGIDYARSGMTVDGFSELWFDNLYDMNTSITPEIRKELADDEELIMDDVKVIVTIQNVVIPIVCTGKPLTKRMSLIRRRQDVDAETFKREWWEVHSDLVRAFTGVRGYNQCLIVDRIIGGKSMPYEELPIDGVVELWFEDTSGLEESFASPAGQKAQAHAKTFIEEVTAFLVDVCPILDK